MADEKVLTSDSKHRVAFDLMKLIYDIEPAAKPFDRAYFLTLYRQCYKAVNGHVLEEVLRQDPKS
jgi:hypothetical protein